MFRSREAKPRDAKKYRLDHSRMSFLENRSFASCENVLLYLLLQDLFIYIILLDVTPVSSIDMTWLSLLMRRRCHEQYYSSLVIETQDGLQDEGSAIPDHVIPFYAN